MVCSTRPRFAAIVNAVTLAKLALLDNAGLLQLAALAGGTEGVPKRADGLPAFTGVDNIMANAFVSFDGNHQWLDAAPPRPRTVGPFLPPELNETGKRPYPFPNGYRSVAGFEPWHPTLREALFRKLFVGPISPGIENPSEIGMVSRVPDAYPYRPCIAQPFPAPGGPVPLRPGPVADLGRSDATAGAPITPDSTQATARAIVRHGRKDLPLGHGICNDDERSCEAAAARMVRHLGRVWALVGVVRRADWPFGTPARNSTRRVGYGRRPER